MELIDRDKDGIPDAEQITVEELDLISRHFGEATIDIMRDPARRASGPGRQNDPDFNPDDCEFVGELRISVIRDRRTGKRYTVNYTRLVQERVVEMREGHSLEGGVMGGRASAFSSLALSKMGSFGPYVVAILGAGGSVPALLVNAAAGLLRKSVKSKAGNSWLDSIFGTVK